MVKLSGEVDSTANANKGSQFARQVEGVVEVQNESKPMVVIEQLGDSNVLLRIYAWVDQGRYSFAKVRSEAIRKVKQAFDGAGIVMPEPIYKLRVFRFDSEAYTE